MAERGRENPVLMDRMTKSDQGDGERLRAMVDDIVRKVPRHAARTVIDEIENKAQPGDHRADALRGALVDHFNRLRPMKARRLFTSLFEPLLIDDPILFRARAPVPGLAQRADIGGLWAALERMVFPATAKRVQARLDEMSRVILLDHALETEEAREMREAMRIEAASYLRKLGRDRKARDEFLAVANAEALEEAKHKSPHLTGKAPIDGDALAFLESILWDNAYLNPLIQHMAAELSDKPPIGEDREAAVDREAAALAGYEREIRGRFPDRDVNDPVLFLPALIALNNRRRHDVTRRFLREYAAASSFDGQPLHQAVFGHFTAAASTLADVARAALGQDRVAVEISLPRATRELLDNAVRRLEGTMTVMSAGGLMGNRVIGPKVRPTLADVAAVFTGLVLPLCEERMIAALNSRNIPEADHDDVVWLMGLVWSWGALLGRAGYAGTETRALKSRVRDEAREAFLAAIKIEPEDIPERRIDHVVRINQLLRAVGDNIGPWISPVSRGLQEMIRMVLEIPRLRTPEVEFVVEHYFAAVRAELGRSRNWQSRELVELMALYEKSR